MNHFSKEEARELIKGLGQEGLDATLFAAVACGEYRAAVVAIEAGAEVKQSTIPIPLLIMAIKDRNFPMFKLLLSHPNIDINVKDWFGESATELVRNLPEFTAYLENYKAQSFKADV